MKGIIAVIILMMIFNGILFPANAEESAPMITVEYESRFMTLEEISEHVNDIYRPPVYVEVSFTENGEVALNVFLCDNDTDPNNEYRVNHVVLKSTQWVIEDGRILVNGEILYKVAEHGGNI